jgi:hypothetical protein
MIVDTGATHHVIADWLAKELSLSVTASGDKATDHTGKAVDVGRVENVSLSISGWGAVNPPLILVTPLPPVLRKLGIGGVLSPQLLAPAGHATLLDLRGRSMSDEPEDLAVRHAEEQSGGATAFSSARACGGATAGLVLLAQAVVEGEPAWLKLDSGASASSLFAPSAAGKKVLARGKGKGGEAYAAGGKFSTMTVPGAKVILGGLERVVDISVEALAPPASCPSDGFLGMDVLRSCVLVLRGEKTLGRCFAQ